jgi:hypothetical protein
LFFLLAFRAFCQGKGNVKLCVNYPSRREAGLNANGTAIGVVCVTGAAIRLIVLVTSKERVPVASQYGAVFAITVREGFIMIAVQGDS